MRTLYQKPRKPRAKQAPRPPVPKVVLPLPEPYSCAVRCPRCRGEATWSVPCTSVAASPDEIDSPSPRRRIVLTRHLGYWIVIWHFPDVFPPTHARAPRSMLYMCAYRHQGNHGEFGVRLCTSCGTRTVANWNWPRSAFFQTTVRGRRLFAQNRADWTGLREFIAATDRRERYRRGRAPWFARYLPAAALAAKNREAVVRAMDRVLSR